MKKNLSVWQLAGFTFTAVFGTLFHFLYEWTGLPFFAPFCAVNESTWEHMKILFFPMLLFAVIQSFFSKDSKNFWAIKLLGITLGVLLIPILFYTYNGAFGKSPDWLNILFFFIAAGAGFLLEFALFKKERPSKNNNVWAIILLIFIAVLFVLFTFFPPKLPLFQDPLSNLYGFIL